MGFTYDYSKQDVSGPAYVQPGRYSVAIESVDERYNQNGEPKLMLHLRTENYGSPVWEHLVLKDSTRWKVKQVVDAVFGPQDDGAEIELGKATLQDRKAVVDLSLDDQYDPNRPRNKVAYWVPRSEAESPPDSGGKQSNVDPWEDDDVPF